MNDKLMHIALIEMIEIESLHLSTNNARKYMQTISRLLSLATTGKKSCLYIFSNFQGHLNNKEEWVLCNKIRLTTYMYPYN